MMVEKNEMGQTAAGKTGKISSAWKSTRKFAMVAVLAGGLMLSPALARAQGSPAVTSHLTAKTMVRSYDGGRKSGVGIGSDAGLDIGKMSMGGSLSAVWDGNKTQMEESGLWIAMPLGKKITATGYGYTDLIYNVEAPAYGLNASGYGLKVGGELGKGFQDVYLKMPLGDVTPGATALFWDGRLQKITLSLRINSKVEGLALSTEALYGKLIHEGDGSLSLRVTMAVPIK